MLNRKRWYISGAFILLLGVFVGLVLSSHLDMMTSLPAKSQVSPKSVEALTQLSDALSEIAGVATPSVVNISTTRVIKTKNNEEAFDFFDDPFFRRFFGDQYPHPNLPKEHRSRAWARE